MRYALHVYAPYAIYGSAPFSPRWADRAIAAAHSRFAQSRISHSSIALDASTSIDESRSASTRAMSGSFGSASFTLEAAAQEAGDRA
jgi:hypothetical protein